MIEWSYISVMGGEGEYLTLWTWLSRDRVQPPCMKSTRMYKPWNVFRIHKQVSIDTVILPPARSCACFLPPVKV